MFQHVRSVVLVGPEPRQAVMAPAGHRADLIERNAPAQRVIGAGQSFDQLVLEPYAEVGRSWQVPENDNGSVQELDGRPTHIPAPLGVIPFSRRPGSAPVATLSVHQISARL